MTPTGSVPAPTAPDPAPRSGGPWPEGFRGIGAHLIRPRAKPEPAEPLPTVSPDWVDAHGSHLLAPIGASADGSRTAACPVCVNPTPLPPTGGWLNVHCSACGTEFVASDGSPPPVPPPPPPAPTPVPVSPPARHSPLAPPPFDWLPPLPDRPVSFTSDVRTDPDGRRFVICPLCLGAEVTVTGGEEVAAFPTCPACHRSFLVNLPRDDAPPPPVPYAPAAPVYDPHGRLWTRCPSCKLEALAPGRVGDAFVLTCVACGQRVVVGEGPSPPHHPLLPPLPSVWERIRRWFTGG